MESFLIYGFILGLTSNLHCIGMCGPIALAIPVNRSSNYSILWGILQYNMGRVLTYTALGMLAGVIGITVNTFKWMQWISILVGIAMIFFAWRKILSNKLVFFNRFSGIESFISKSIGKIMSRKFPLKLPMLGALNGLLPCGMVYFALINAVLGGTIINSALAMTAFGIGTLPAMILISFTANRISPEFRKKATVLVPYLLTFLGLIIILRGMNLNIPFISPKISSTEQSHVKSDQEHKNESVEMSCCHKKSEK